MEAVHATWVWYTSAFCALAPAEAAWRTIDEDGVAKGFESREPPMSNSEQALTTADISYCAHRCELTVGGSMDGRSGLRSLRIRSAYHVHDSQRLIVITMRATAVMMPRSDTIRQFVPNHHVLIRLCDRRWGHPGIKTGLHARPITH